MNTLLCNDLESRGCLEVLFQLVHLGVNNTVDRTVCCAGYAFFAQELIHLC